MQPKWLPIVSCLYYTSSHCLFFHVYLAHLLLLIQKGQGAPAREQAFNEEQKKQMMAHAYRKQEEFKVLVIHVQRTQK